MACARLLVFSLLVGGFAFVPSASATCVATGAVCHWDTDGDGVPDMYWIGKNGNYVCVNLDSQTKSEGECGAYTYLTGVAGGPGTGVDYRYRREAADNQTYFSVIGWGSLLPFPVGVAVECEDWPETHPYPFAELPPAYCYVHTSLLN